MTPRWSRPIYSPLWRLREHILAYSIHGQLRDEEFAVRVATTLEEDQKLIKAGFEYVTDRDGAKIHRKRK